jgi:hypothetical protein
MGQHEGGGKVLHALLKVPHDKEALELFGSAAEVQSDKGRGNAGRHVLARQGDDGNSGPQCVSWQGQ